MGEQPSEVRVEGTMTFRRAGTPAVPNDAGASHRDASEAFAVYQASVAMVAIFLGFLFSGLLVILTSQDEVTHTRRITVWSLVAGMLLLTAGLVFLDGAAHRIIRHLGAFYPRSWLTKAAALTIAVGILAMYGGVGALLWDRGMIVAAVFVSVAALALVLLGSLLHYLAHRGATHLVDM